MKSLKEKIEEMASLPSKVEKKKKKVVKKKKK
jgi:hypothetical protein